MFLVEVLIHFFLINDSAVGVTWGNYKVASGQTFGVRFYISGATGTVEPSDVTSNFFTSGKALQSASFVAESDKLKAEEVIEYVVVCVVVCDIILLCQPMRY